MKYIKKFEYINIELSNKESENIMYQAITDADVNLIKKLLNSGFNFKDFPNLTDKIIVNENFDVIRIILDSGFNVNSKNSEGLPMLYYQLKKQLPKLDIIKLLFDYGADPNMIFTISYASFRRNFDRPITCQLLQIISNSSDIINIVKIFIKHNANFLLKDSNGKCYLDYLYDRDDRLIVRRYPIDEILSLIKKELPEQYKQFLISRNAEKYNI